ncbi:MAG: NUDIX domain-containing protein [Alphaproteobacteria bacterium]|nr:NUDIX domain-containing protein [Alphaproteobacteria bacterium]
MADESWPVDDNPWRVKAARRAFENNWFAVDEHDVVRPDGGDGYYGVIRVRRVAVGVLPIEDDGRVHLVGQWRFPLGRYSWEMPEGGADPGETPEVCARRELAEETGLSAVRLTEILRMDLSNSLTDEQAVIFLATGLAAGSAAPEETERLRSLLAPFSAVLEAVATGRITDAMTVAGVLRAHHMAVTGEITGPLGAILRG